MAFRNIGPTVVLEPGQSVTWSYSWPGGQDMGLQIAGPDLHPAPGALGTVVARDQGITTNGFNNVSYRVTTAEIDGHQTAIVNLQLGGVE